MNKKKHQILLNALQNASSEDVDLFLEVDLLQTFKLLNKDKYDNDFDLSAQFIRERDASRDFRIYGEIASTVINCDNLTIKVFSDENYQNQLGSVQTSSISYGRNNVFGKKRGKYLINLNGYPQDVVYLQIDSNDFNYAQQRWSQRLVYYNADGDFVSYGSETFDINLDNSVLIENNFPFFFNKHWIKLDYNIIEEKIAKYSWLVPENNLLEGQSIEMILSLDKPSPFGNEELTLKWKNSTEINGFNQGEIQSTSGSQTIYQVNFPTGVGDELSVYNGQVYVVVPSIIFQKISPGQDFNILNGDYSGIYTIESIFFLEGSPALILNTVFDSGLNLNNSTIYSIGSAPDVTITLNDQIVSLPLDLTWEIGEQSKVFSLLANNDFEVELSEIYDIEGVNEVRVEKGSFPYKKISVQDSTIRKEVRYNFGNLWENRGNFTGRTSYDVNTGEFDRTAPGPAILRNGTFWEGRNEEFYPNDFFKLRITNEGIKTIIPQNDILGIESPIIFESQETKEFTVATPYSDFQLHTAIITYQSIEGFELDDESPNLFINGVSIPPSSLLFGGYGYSSMKPSLDSGSSDWYISNFSPKPFTATFDDDNQKIILTSKSPGVRLVVETDNPFAQVSYNTSFQENPQIPLSISLYANAEQNQTARYRFSMNKQSFKEVYIPSKPISAFEGSIVDVYLVTGYKNILYPYDSSIQQSFFSKNANDMQSVTYYEAANTPAQHQLMEYGNTIINGALFLSSSIFPNSENNITEQGFFLNDSDEDEFLGEFRNAPIEPIPSTSEVFSPQDVRAIWELDIKNMSSLGDDFEGRRGFDITLGEGDGAYTLSVGGFSSNPPVKRGAYQWWTQFYISVSDDNGPITPFTSLKLRLDEGSGDEIPEGPFSGVVSSEKMILISKTPGINVAIDNVSNFDGYNQGEDSDFVETLGPNLTNVFNEQDNLNQVNISPFAIKARQLAPGLQVGDLNTGRNGLGGFRLDLE